jgi:hypothetical protein
MQYFTAGNVDECSITLENNWHFTFLSSPLHLIELHVLMTLRIKLYENQHNNSKNTHNKTNMNMYLSLIVGYRRNTI